MDSDRVLPEDGSLQSMGPLTDSFNTNNIMLVKFPEEMRKTGNLIFDFATLDRTIPGLEWPADKYIDSLIPGLKRVEIIKEPGESNDEESDEKEEEEEEMPIVTKPVSKQNSYQRPSQFKSLNPSRSKAFRPRATAGRTKNWNGRSENYRQWERPSDNDGIEARRKRNWNDGPEIHRERERPPAEDIEPWMYKPWEVQPCFPIGNKLPLNGSVLNTYPRQPEPAFFAPPPMPNIPIARHKKTTGLLGDAPPGNSNFENINSDCYNNSFSHDSEYTAQQPPNPGGYDNFRRGSGYRFQRGNKRSSNAKFENVNKPPPSSEYDNNYAHDSRYAYPREDRQSNPSSYDNFGPRDVGTGNSFNTFVPNSRDVGTGNSFNNFVPSSRDDPNSCANNFKGRTFKKGGPQRSYNGRVLSSKSNTNFWNNKNQIGFVGTETPCGIPNAAPSSRPHGQRRPLGRKSRNNNGRSTRSFKRRNRGRQNF